MFPKRLTLSLVAAFLLFFSLWTPELTSGQIPSPRPPNNEMQMRAPAPGGEATPQNALVEPGPQFIATSSQRIDRDRAEMRVYRNGQPVELFPSFHELLTARSTGRQMGLDRLVGRSIALVPSEKRAEQWDIFAGVGGVGDLVLAGNIFKVRQVLLSSRKNPIEVRIDGQIHRLKPGEALLVL